LSAVPAAPPITFDPISGPALKPITVRPERAEAPLTLGRSSGCELTLADPDGVISRQHAQIAFQPGEPFPWRITDLKSRHGTFVNTQRVEPGQWVPLSAGDQVRLGPWTFRVIAGEAPVSRRLAHTMDDRRFTGTLMQRLPEQTLESAASRRLTLLMRCAADIATARTEPDVASVALAALVEGVGLPRCAFIRLAGDDDVEVLGSSGLTDELFSRSLLHAAAEAENYGQTVVLNPGQAFPEHAFGQSVAALEISAALCAPIMVERMSAPRADGFASKPPPRAVAIPDAFLYLDSRGGDRASAPISSETVAFCQAVAKLSGLALSNLSRARLEQEDHRRRAELDAARDVQRIIMPTPSGVIGERAGRRVSYHMLSIPGRHVAGDLFDVFPIDASRVGVFIGDVVGKGVAAGMVMSNVQAHLSRLLRASGDPAHTLTEVSSLVAQYSERLSAEQARVSLFISLFAAVIDLDRDEITYTDAGHGFAILRRPGARPERPFILGGAPLGVSPESVYESSTIPMEAGARLILYSDGLIEQRGTSGEAFGVDRALAAIGAASDPRDEVDRLVTSLRAHCGAEGEATFADDVTVASVALEATPGG